MGGRSTAARSWARSARSTTAAWRTSALMTVDPELQSTRARPAADGSRARPGSTPRGCRDGAARRDRQGRPVVRDDGLCRRLLGLRTFELHSAAALAAAATRRGLGRPIDRSGRASWPSTPRGSAPTGQSCSPRCGRSTADCCLAGARRRPASWPATCSPATRCSARWARPCTTGRRANCCSAALALPFVEPRPMVMVPRSNRARRSNCSSDFGFVRAAQLAAHAPAAASDRRAGAATSVRPVQLRPRLRYGSRRVAGDRALLDRRTS